jgi:predicted RNA-binding protein with PUA-like domain
MKSGDLCLFYHSNDGREIVGLARVAQEAYPDPADDSGTWVVVELAFEEKFPAPLTLAEIKSLPALANFELIRQSRLSVCTVREEEFNLILKLTHP